MSKQISPLHQAARDLAAQGVPVFPCIPGGKAPATANGFHDATTDAAQIDAWWGETPDLNIAFSPHSVGLSVVDLDGPAAHAEWANLEFEHGLAPDTYTVATPRPGGLHRYYRGELPPTQHKLGPHIDTRGRGSYALVPPSVIDGRGEADPAKHGSYRAAGGDPSNPAVIPAWINPFLESLKRDHAKAATTDPDLPQNLLRAETLLRGYVERGHVAIEGEGGDTRTFAIACEVMNLGVSQETTFKLLSEIWNPACQPPWEDDELEVKVENAARYAQNEPGAWAVPPASEVFGSVLDKLDLKPTQAGRSRYYPFSLEEMAALPPPTWLVEDMIPSESLVLMYGQPGSYKSFIAMQLGLQLAAAGKPVVYIGAEGSRGLELRAAAWKLLNGVSVPIPFKIVRNMPWAASPDQIAEFVAEMKAQGVQPELVIVDTVARMMTGMNENDAKDVGLFVAALEGIQRAFKCTVAGIHHSGKDEGRGARGSNALLGAMDAAFEVKAVKEVKAVSMWCRKQKDADERAEPWTYEGKAVGQSLVFQATTPQEHRLLTATDDILAPKKVASALVRLRAVGDENAVTTRVLAAELVPPSEDETPEAREQAVGRMARAIAARATTTLEAYALGEGRDRLWGLPS